MLNESFINKLMLTKYMVDDIIVLFSNGDTGVIDKLNIGAVHIEKDFDNDNMPILMINAAITRELYKKIVADKDKAKVKVTINKFNVKPKENNMGELVKYVEPALTGVFNMVINDVDLDSYTKLQNKDFDNGRGLDNKKGIEKQNTNIDLILFKEESLDMNKQLDSYIFTNTDIITPMVFLAEKAGVKRLLITPPDNSNRYNQLIISGNKFTDMIEGIHQMYGIYNTGYRLFFDFDKMYILDKSTSTKTLEPNELALVFIYFGEYGEGANRHVGNFIDKSNNRYFINCIKEPSIVEAGSYIKEALYNKINAVNTGDNKHHQTSANVGGRGVDSTVLLDNKYNNPFLLNSEIHRIKESVYSATLNLPEVDFTMFTPNKQYSFNFDINDMARAQKYNGLYRITRMTTSLVKDKSESYMKGSTVAFFTATK